LTPKDSNLGRSSSLSTIPQRGPRSSSRLSYSELDDEDEGPIANAGKKRARSGRKSGPGVAEGPPPKKSKSSAPAKAHGEIGLPTVDVVINQLLSCIHLD
jgi:hypothetical protein